MGNATVDERLLARLARALAPRDEILEAYLFGSHARGQAGSDSDVDHVEQWLALQANA